MPVRAVSLRRNVELGGRWLGEGEGRVRYCSGLVLQVPQVQSGISYPRTVVGAACSGDGRPWRGPGKKKQGRKKFARGEGGNPHRISCLMGK